MNIDKNKKKNIIIVFVGILILTMLISLSVGIKKNNKTKTSPNIETPIEEPTKDIESDTNNIEEEPPLEEPQQEELPVEEQKEEKEKTDNKNKKTTNKSSNKSTKSNDSSKPNESSNTNTSPNIFKITSSGVHNLSGKYDCITINTSGDVILNLNKVTIKCPTGPGIYVENARAVTINTESSSSITATTTQTLDGAIFSTSDLVLKGNSTLTVNSNYDGIVSKDNLTFNSGTYEVTSSDDAIRGKDSVKITNGKFILEAGADGIKATNDTTSSKGYVTIDNGTISITAKNDAIQAESYITVNNGIFNIKTKNGYSGGTSKKDSAKGFKAETNINIKGGSFIFNTGDDSINSNGNVTITNGTLKIKTADDAIHADENFTLNNGTITITNCFEGIEANNVYIKGGNTQITSTDDGINSAPKNTRAYPGMEVMSNGTIEISGGYLKIFAKGDALDSNGTILIKGGTSYIESSSKGPEENIDHIGLMKITGGTFVSVSRYLATDDGEEISTIPYLHKDVALSSGTISIGGISYKPLNENYQYILIASDTLETGPNILTVGSKTINVELTTGEIIITK